MPFKFNVPQRHRIPGARYRVRNWSGYDRNLVRRGDIKGLAVAGGHSPAGAQQVLAKHSGIRPSPPPPYRSTGHLPCRSSSAAPNAVPLAAIRFKQIAGGDGVLPGDEHRHVEDRPLPDSQLRRAAFDDGGLRCLDRHNPGAVHLDAGLADGDGELLARGDFECLADIDCVGLADDCLKLFADLDALGLADLGARCLADRQRIGFADIGGEGLADICDFGNADLFGSRHADQSDLNRASRRSHDAGQREQAAGVLANARAESSSVHNFSEPQTEFVFMETTSLLLPLRQQILRTRPSRKTCTPPHQTKLLPSARL